jgi:hypothetical protein
VVATEVNEVSEVGGSIPIPTAHQTEGVGLRFSAIALVRSRIRRGYEGYSCLCVDYGLLFAGCGRHTGPRSSADCRTNQSALATARQSADECARCGSATYFGYVALGMAFAVRMKAAG